MRSADAFSLLRTNAQPFFTTREAAAIFKCATPSATKLLQNLTDLGLIRKVEQGRWAANPNVSSLEYAGWVASPLPSYISLYTALFHRGIIQQIPRTIYVVSLAKTEIVQTDLGDYSIHQISPALFRGYIDENGVKMATAEKALFDTLYLERATSGKFAALTEVELPEDFDRQELLSYLDLITDTVAGVRRRAADSIRDFLSKLD
jgi:predicted transcriptional regulator of viral defense system